MIWIVTFLAMLALTSFAIPRMGRACRACAEDLKWRVCLALTPTG